MALLGQLGELVLTAADRRLTALQISPAPLLPAPDGCYLRTGNSHVHVRWEEIVCIRAEGDYTRVELRGGREFHELKSLAMWEAMLPGHEFGRIHRSWIVGWRHLQRLQRSSGGRWTLHLHGRDALFPVGRVYHPAIRQRINVRGRMALTLSGSP
jgi:DNA-binding LytR/AlgR family response regulator